MKARALKMNAAVWLAMMMVVSLGAARARGAETAARPPASRADRDKAAVADFTAGRYDRAARAFTELYNELHDPVYLRNIGRCHQRLGNADAALANFGQYLRTATALAPGEREEVQGFMKEMEHLKEKRAAETTEPPRSETTPPTMPAPSPPPPLPPAPVIAPGLTPAALEVRPPPAASPPPSLGAVPSPPSPRASDDGTPSPRTGRLRTGFVALGIGAALGVGAGVAALRSRDQYTAAVADGCLKRHTPDCDVRADNLTMTNRVALGLAAGATLSALVGVGFVVWGLNTDPAPSGSQAAYGLSLSRQF